jgi:hypothetical protein
MRHPKVADLQLLNNYLKGYHWSAIPYEQPLLTEETFEGRSASELLMIVKEYKEHLRGQVTELEFVDSKVAQLIR